VDIRRPDVGALVQKHRDAAGLTQGELAGLVGVTQGALSAIERNRRDPSLETLIRLLDVLDLELKLGVTDRTAAIDAAIEAVAERPLGDRLRLGAFDGVVILDRLTAACPVVEGAGGAILHGAPVEADHLAVAVAKTDLAALAAGLRSLAADRWSKQYGVFGPADPDPRSPGEMRWSTIAGEVRVRLVDEPPEALTVLVGDVLARVRPLHDIEATDPYTARVLARLRTRLAIS
jgi:transcriptional regulator with XRE-family HTH domain